jgi:hypothetical protein
MSTIQIPDCSNLVQKRDSKNNLLWSTRTRTTKDADGVTQTITERIPVIYLMLDKPAWHSLGEVCKTSPSIDDIHKFMDTHLELEDSYIYTEQGKHIVPGALGVNWNGRCIGTIGNSTMIYQNKTFVDKLKGWLDVGLKFSSVGYLEAGAKVFASMKIDLDLKIGNSSVDLFVNHHHGHCNQLSHFVGVSSVNQVCGNTVGMANSEMRKLFSTFQYKHTKSQGEKLDKVQEVLGKYIQGCKENVEMHNKLADLKVTKEDLFAYYKEVTKSKATKAEELQKRAKGVWEQYVEAFESSPGCEGRSWLDALSGMTNLLTYTTVTKEGESFADRVGRTLERWSSSEHQSEADRRTVLAAQMAGVL